MAKALVEVYLTPVPTDTLEDRLSKVFRHEGMIGDGYVLTESTFTVYHDRQQETVTYNDGPSFTVDIYDLQGVGLGVMVFCLTLAALRPVSMVCPPIIGMQEWAAAIMIVQESLGLTDETVARILSGWRVEYGIGDKLYER